MSGEILNGVASLDARRGHDSNNAGKENEKILRYKRRIFLYEAK